jgi:hypothetical protein
MNPSPDRTYLSPEEEQALAVAVVSARVAGVHPEWIEWALAYPARDNIKHMLGYMELYSQYHERPKEPFTYDKPCA